MKTINKGDTVYYTRVFPETGTYDLCDLVIRTVMDNWFCGVDKKDKRAYLLGFNEIDENVFDNRSIAPLIVDFNKESVKIDVYKQLEINWNHYIKYLWEI